MAKTILVVEDEASTRDLLTTALKKAAYVVKAARRHVAGRAFYLLSLSFILFGLSLAFPAGASASNPGGWDRQFSGGGILEGIASADATHLWAVGSIADSTSTTTGVAILFSSDGGATWSQQETGVGLKGVACADDSHAWAVGTTYNTAGNPTGGTILATSDGGATWSTQDTVTSNALGSVTCADDSHAWAVGPNPGNGAGPILATTDGGASWTAQPVGSGDWIVAITCADDSHAWAVGYDSKTNSGIILSTANGGATWKVRRTSFLLTAITCADASHVWAVGFDRTTLSGAILASSNGGATWRLQRTATEHEFTSVTCAGDRHACAATTNGMVFATRNGGLTWSQQRTGTSDSLTGIACAGTWHVWTVGWAMRSSPLNTHGVIFSTTTGGYSNPLLTLKLVGLTGDVVRLGKSVAAKGTVRPASMAGAKVILVIQREREGKWLRFATLARAISAGGAYRLTVKPAREGNYRIKARIAKTGASAAAATRWLTFKVR
jgi:photosystem II stability/assembly factor-like uncharacterized protein